MNLIKIQKIISDIAINLNYSRQYKRAQNLP